jgi:hypothetical protein
MPILMSLLSVACLVGAVVSFLRCNGKYFDLLVLCGVILLSSAVPSFEVDASLEELKSINQRLQVLHALVEKLGQH